MKPRTYFRSLLNTCTSLQYYVDVLNSKFTFSVRFFLMSYGVLSLIAAGLFATIEVPLIKQQTAQALAQLQQNYPSTLQLSWDQHVLHSTATTPIALHYPSFFHRDFLPPVLGYIDPQASSVDDVLKKVDQKSYFIVTKDRIAVSNDQQTWSDVPLADVYGFDQPFLITKENLPQFVTIWQNTLNSVLSVVTWLYPIGYFLFVPSSRLFGLLINALLIMYVVRIFRFPLPFRKILQVVLHVSVVAELVQLLTAYAFPQHGLPMYEITFWGYLLLIMNNFRHVLQIRVIAPTKKSQ